LDFNEPERIVNDDCGERITPLYIQERLEKHDGFNGSILGSSIDNNEPFKLGN
jgi:hypothetical protein